MSGQRPLPRGYMRILEGRGVSVGNTTGSIAGQGAHPSRRRGDGQDPLRIGYDVSDIDPHLAGLYTYASGLLDHLATRDDVALSLVDPRGLPHTRAHFHDAAHGVTVDRLPYHEARVLPALHLSDGPWQKDRRTRRLAYEVDARLLFPFWDRVSARRGVARWCLPRETAATLDVCHWAHNSFVNLPHAAHVATVHDVVALVHPEWQLPLENRRHARWLRLVARHATRLIVDATHTHDALVDLLDVDPARIDVVPLAADPAFGPPRDLPAVDDVLARYGLTRHDYVLCVSTVEPRKNVVRLAAAFKTVLDRLPSRATTLVLVGARGWQTEGIDAGLDAVGLGPRLVRPGNVPLPDLVALVQGTGVVAYVSLYEGFGLPPLEAMACGTPVVCSSTSSLPAVVGDAALSVDPLDVGAIAGALERILGDEATRRDLAARGLQRAGAFSWQRTAALTAATYRRAVADRLAAPCPR